MFGLKNMVIYVLLLCVSYGFAQRGYQKDSLQFKVYTELVIDHNIELDTIIVKKVICDYCTQAQLKAIGRESLPLTYNMRNEKRFQKKGAYSIVHYLRIAKDNFQEYSNSEDNKNE